MTNLIPDTDEELIAEAFKYKAIIHRGIGGKVHEIIFTTDQLRALINHCIAKYRAQWQEPVAIVNVVNGAIRPLTLQQYATPIEDGQHKLYTHAQPIAEIQAEGRAQQVLGDLPEAAEAVYQTCLEKWGEANGVTVDAKAIVEYFKAAKLRKGE